jgi:serine phosphatase RsbU (regulator of sigma subunit)
MIFFMWIYSGEKLSAIFESELSDTSQVASHLETLLSYAGILNSDQIHSSKEIIFSMDRACDRSLTTPPTVSDAFSKPLEDVHFSIQAVLDDPAFANACNELKKATSDHLNFQFVQGKVKFLVPYILVLIPPNPPGLPAERLVMVSLDGSNSGGGSDGSVLVNQSGGIVWSSLGEKDLHTLLTVAGLKTEDLATQAARTLKTGVSGLNRVGSQGFIAYAPVISKWVFFSIGSQRQVSDALQFIFWQSFLLLGSFLSLCIVFGRRMALRLSRPLSALAEAAEKIGAGDLKTQVKVEGDQEFKIVQNTFNHMIQQISGLMHKTRESARMESELALTEKVQQMLLPPPLTKFPQHEIRSYIKNAEQCGGDWWGCFEAKSSTGQTQIVILIGDVTGHGAPSALLTAAAQGGMTILQSWIEKDPGLLSDSRELLRLFNLAVYQSSRGTLTMSFLVTVIDAGAETVTISNGGHNWPYLIIPKGVGAFDVKSVGAASPVLGASLTQVFEHRETHPWPIGSKMFLYTDGLTDCFQGDKNLFDRRAMIHILKRSGGKSAAQLLEDLLRERNAKIKGIKAVDDVTVVICSREAK